MFLFRCYDFFFVYNVIQTSCFFFLKKVAEIYVVSKLANAFRWLLMLIETPVRGLQTTSHDRGAGPPLNPTQLC